MSVPWSETWTNSTITLSRLSFHSFFSCIFQPFQWNWSLYGSGRVTSCKQQKLSLDIGQFADQENQPQFHISRDPKPCHRTGFMRKSPKLFPLGTNQILWFLCCHFCVRNSILLQTWLLPVSVASLYQEFSLEGSESQVTCYFIGRKKHAVLLPYVGHFEIYVYVDKPYWWSLGYLTFYATVARKAGKESLLGFHLGNVKWDLEGGKFPKYTRAAQRFTGQLENVTNIYSIVNLLFAQQTKHIPF